MLVLSFIIAYILFADRSYTPLHDALVFLGYFGTFLAGFLYAYAFTAAPAAAILLILAKEQNILFAGFIAGVGALLSDLVIFHFIRHGFKDEVQKLRKERIVCYAQNKVPKDVKKYLFASLAVFLIASPLPTEIGVTLMASMKSISTKKFTIIAYSLHTSAIFVILLIGSII